MSDQLTRRRLLEQAPASVIGAGLAAGSLMAPVGAIGEETKRKPGESAERFLLGLNTSTIRGQKLGIVREVEIAAKAGFRGLEPWIGEIEDYQKSGGSLPDLKKRIADAGLRVESTIGFFDWVVDDEVQRRKGLETAKRNMDLVQRIGGIRIAAPPVGATDKEGIDLKRIAERYRVLLEAGDAVGVVPQVELWGFSKTLGKLSEAAYVAIESGHPRACILPDVYHLYRGGSDFSGLPLLGPGAIHVFHANDYPTQPARQELTDAHRVFPGDGVAPLKRILSDLQAGNFRVMLSLELFHREYWKQDPLAVAQAGFKKMKDLVESLPTAESAK